MALNFVAKLAITAAMTGVQMAMSAMRKIEGPRLDDLSVTIADYGTVIPRFWGKRRFEVPIIWAENLREKKSTSKTKGGKYKQYKYYGTWAVLICDQEIDAVSRIWMDKHLVYQATSAGPVSVASLIKSFFNQDAPVKLTSQNMRIYTGTETQEPDPRIEAWCEDQAAFGPDSCPAFRGSSYIVFQDIPLEKFGNRIPQITVEAVREKTANYIYETVQTERTQACVFRNSGSGEYMAVVDLAVERVEWWDAPSRTKLSTSLLGSVGVLRSAPGMDYDGTIWFATSENLLKSCAPNGIFSQTAIDGAYNFYDQVRIFGRFVYVTFADTGTGRAGYLIDGGLHSHAQSARDFCVDSDGVVWGVFHPMGSSADFTVESLAVGGASETLTAGSTRSKPGYAFIVYNEDEDHFLVGTNGEYYLIDRSTLTVKSSGAAAFSRGPQGECQQQPGLSTWWVVGNQYSTATGALVRSVDFTDWLTSSGSEFTYDLVNNALWARQTGPTNTNINIYYLDRIANVGVTLGTIVDDVSGWVGLTDADTSQLTQVIEGYSVTQGPAKDMIAPLLDAYDVDARPHDFGVQFVVRSGVSSGTITAGEFVREGDSARYVATVAQDTDLARRVSLNFADKAKDQQNNTAVWQRPEVASDSSREVTIDLTTWVADADTAKPLVERYGRRIWNERQGVTLSLTAQYLGLEPGDVKTLTLDDVSWTARCVKASVKGSVIETEWKRDFPSLAVLSSNPGSGLDAQDVDSIIIPAQSKGFVLDTPLLQDADSDINPLLYFAAGRYSGGNYTGTTFYKLDAGVYDEEWGTVEQSEASTWGTVSEAMSNANPWLWDRGTSLTVNLFSGGTLSTVTEAQIDANPLLNLAAIGVPGRYELVQFTTATLVSDNTWTVSGFKRGRRGTEWACSLHEANDEFLLLTQVANVDGSLSEVGEAYSFKTASVGRENLSAAIDFTFSGATLKPYAPARVVWSTDGADLFGTIIRRTRVGGSWVGGATIPLSENSEAYEVDVLDGSGNVTSTIELSGTNSFTISGLTSPPDVNVYQLSDSVGRGFALAA